LKRYKAAPYTVCVHKNAQNTIMHNKLKFFPVTKHAVVTISELLVDVC